MKQTKAIYLLEDSQLIALYKNENNKEAVGVLYKRYTGFIFAVCMKFLKDKEAAKDAVMEIFEELFSKLIQHNVNHFKSWLYIVAKNHCLHIIRKANKIYSFEWDERRNNDLNMENLPFLYPDNEKLLDKHLDNLEPAIESLSVEQKTCIILFYMQGKSYDEITLVTGYDLKKVKSYIQNGKRNLKIQLLKENG